MAQVKVQKYYQHNILKASIGYQGIKSTPNLSYCIISVFNVDASNTQEAFNCCVLYSLVQWVWVWKGKKLSSVAQISKSPPPKKIKK